MAPSRELPNPLSCFLGKERLVRPELLPIGSARAGWLFKALFMFEKDVLDVDPLREPILVMMGLWFKLSTASSHLLRYSLRFPCAAYSMIMYRGPPTCTQGVYAERGEAERCEL